MSAWRVFLLIGCPLLVFTTAMADGWEWQNPWPQGCSLHSITFATPSRGWAVGEEGVILHTSDGGASWLPQDSDTAGDLNDVCFVDSLMGWAAGEGRIRRTTDGGWTWAPQTAGYMTQVRDLFFIDATRGWILGPGNFRTTDGGATWRAAHIPGYFIHSDILFLDEYAGWALGWQEGISRTTDGGASWETYPIPGGQFSAMDFIDADNGWVAGDDSSGRCTVFRTTDGGVTWTALPGDLHNIELSEIHFLDADHGWGVGGDYEAALARTTDGGLSWTVTRFYNLMGASLNSLTMIDTVQGWVAGDGGLLYHTTDAGLTWQQATRSVTNASLAGVAFADSLSGVAVGNHYSDYSNEYAALIFRTTNGGAVWQRQDSLLQEWLRDVAMLPTGDGWAVGDSGLILHTGDNGITWDRQSPPCDGRLWDVEFVDDTHGWVVGGGGSDAPCANQSYVLYTRDGGGSWQVELHDSLIGYQDVSCVTGTSVWVAGDSGTVLHTPDGGVSWEERSIPYPWNCYNLTAICFRDDLHGWVSGWGLCGWDFSSFIALQTEDGGQRWWVMDFSFNRMVFADSLRGYVLGWSGAMSTTDGGQNWYRDRSVPRSVGAIDFPDPAHGWAVGYNGTILRYTGAGTVGVEFPARPVPQPASIALSVTPNPFNARTRLTFTIAQTGRVRLAIYDLMGRRVAALTDGRVDAGEHTVAFDASRLPSGVYFASLETAGQSLTRKLVLLK